MEYFTQSPIYLLVKNIIQWMNIIIHQEGALTAMFFSPLFFAMIFILVRFDIYRLSIFVLGYFTTNLVILLSIRTIFYDLVMMVDKNSLVFILLISAICLFAAFLCFRYAFCKIKNNEPKIDNKKIDSKNVFLYGIMFGILNVYSMIINQQYLQYSYEKYSFEERLEDTMNLLSGSLSSIMIKAFVAIILIFMTKIIDEKFRKKYISIIIGILFIVYILFFLHRYIISL
ncbi:hypothetical protein N5853_13390 [Bartonella sp. HY329]|uniref:hypothetical protein n=1 Tax=unclassified Bartonella TaxID=2645622 RepID=UPI0021CA99B6|nr:MULTISPECIES: hypothetical protein [unclassified Bartonella]UXM95056.1 hypothetical protein N5853_13390 [Bartonella sp. HY329]UXN09379.1 hypothetical protein N5852_13395 [Bartonella sp. HY328]